MAGRGLVLMVGATGCGKSTSLAAMVDWRNEHQAGHIISIDQLVKEAEHVFAKMLPPELVEKNLEAMRQGYASGDEI